MTDHPVTNSNAASNGRSVAFVWDNFGPMHADRCDAVAASFGSSREVIGLELFSTSEEYAWNSESGQKFRKITLYRDKTWAKVPAIALAWKIVAACRANGVSDIFLCNYDKTPIFLAGILLRLSGKRVYVMGCSKYDDFKRSVLKEAVKRYVFFLPYQGAIASGKRSRDYMRFLGVPEERVVVDYNSLSLDRIRRLAGLPSAPDGTPFAERHFTIVARFIPKKNLAMALDAYAQYCRNVTSPRQLHLCGSGPMEADLKKKVAELGLTENVVFTGFLQSDGIARRLGTSLALILPSTEEQFGNVVIEAQAMGLPVILSDVCGARDNLVRSGLNGFVVEPDNPTGLAFFMRLLSEDEALWRNQAMHAREFAKGGDTERFAAAALELTGR